MSNMAMPLPLLRRRYLKKYINFTLIAPQIMSPWGKGHEICHLKRCHAIGHLKKLGIFTMTNMAMPLSLLRRRYLKRYINFTLTAPKLCLPGVGVMKFIL